MNKIAVFTPNPECEAKLLQLAQQLTLPIAIPSQEYDYLLVLTEKHLALQKVNSPYSPLIVDFLGGKNAYRRAHTSLRRENLIRAMGLKKSAAVTIIDATAGLGRDSFIIASLGYEVQMIERSPIIHALLQDGLERATHHAALLPIVSRLKLVCANATTYLNHLTADIVYLDPMYPSRQKSSLVKKEMLIFQDILGEDPDADLLFGAAITCAKKRVVVKRPRLSNPLAGQQPSHSIIGRSSRFDVYIINAS